MGGRIFMTTIYVICTGILSFLMTDDVRPPSDIPISQIPYVRYDHSFRYQSEHNDRESMIRYKIIYHDTLYIIPIVCYGNILLKRVSKKNSFRTVCNISQPTTPVQSPPKIMENENCDHNNYGILQQEGNVFIYRISLQKILPIMLLEIISSFVQSLNKWYCI